MTDYRSCEDAAVYRLSDDLAMLQTVDFFPPVVDDPYVFGQIAAANALSDVYAMGGEPRLAMNLLSFPSTLGLDVAGRILAGGADKVREAGAAIAGGHSIEDEEPKYGLCVTGFVRPDRIWFNKGAREGDILLLTKALGVGILLTADNAGRLPADVRDRMIAQMCRLNRYAAQAMGAETGAGAGAEQERMPVHACTDVTGFGLLGHALEMAQASGVSIVIRSNDLPIIAQTMDFAAQGLVSGGGRRNRSHVAVHLSFAQPCDEFDPHILDCLCDPQTSGGLLFSIPEQAAEEALRRIRAHEPEAAVIGRVIKAGETPLVIE